MRDNRRLVVLLGVLGAIVLVGAVFFVFGGGDDGGEEEPITAPPTAAPAPDDGSDGTDGTDGGDDTDGGDGTDGTTTTDPFGPPESFDVFATRNPFEPVIQVTDTAAPGTTPGTTVPGTPTTTSGSTTPGGSGTTSAGGGSFDPSTGQPVALLDVFVDDDGTTKARVQVGSTVFVVSEGEVFATSYRVVSLDVTTGCGQFLYGDAPFELCEGEQVVK